jgi:Gamma-glutamyl cyclotransferase, AIG2-like
VTGTVFEITEAELARADQYEIAAYKRVVAVLASGKQAWMYVDARFAPSFMKKPKSFALQRTPRWASADAARSFV